MAPHHRRTKHQIGDYRIGFENEGRQEENITCSMLHLPEQQGKAK